MKKILPIVYILFLLTFSCCDPLDYLAFINNYKNTIFFTSPELLESALYDDTIIIVDTDTRNSWVMMEVAPRDTNVFVEYVGIRSIDAISWRNDTISFFIFSKDTVDLYSWDTILKYNMLLQRYDVSKTDFEELNKTSGFGFGITWFNFPPTEDMKHIHMWPPYGTYDKDGKKK